MWSFYDQDAPKMFSFGPAYGFLNQQIRDKLQGGPTIIFHRHAEIKNGDGRFHKSVYEVPNGSKYNRLVRFVNLLDFFLKSTCSFDGFLAIF